MAWRSPIDHVRLQLLQTLGLATPLVLVGCGGATASEADEGGGVTTDPSGSGSATGEDGEDEATASGTSSTGMSTSTTGPDDTGGDGDGDDEGVKFDLPPAPDLMRPDECYVEALGVPASNIDPECPLVPGDDGICFSELFWGCVDLPLDATCEDICVEGDCIEIWWNCMGEPVYEPPIAVCGPYLVDGQCCTIAEIPSGCLCEGRPFLVEGEARVAPLLERGAARPSPEFSPALRERLLEHWRRAAQAEHASIASFARFAAQLLEHGAPPQLVRDAHTAAADERRHAQTSLALAQVHADARLAFGPLDLRGASPRRGLAELVGACLREGCVGETLAAIEAGSAASRCTDRKLAASLRAIADDELRHASLAWRVVAWALARTPELRGQVERCRSRLLEATRRGGCGPSPSRVEERQLAAHGCLSEDERLRLRADATHELLVPLLSRLLAPEPRLRPGPATRRSM